MSNYFLLNSFKSSTLGIRNNTPIIPIFLNLADDNGYKIDIECLFKGDIQNHLITLQKILMEELNKDETILTLSDSLNYYYKVNNIGLEIQEQNGNVITYKIYFYINKYRYLIKDSKFIDIYIDNTTNLNYFTIKNDGLECKPVFIINSPIKQDITIATQEQAVILKDVEGTVYLDNYLKDFYNDYELLNNNMDGDFLVLRNKINNISIEASDLTLRVKPNTYTY